MSAERMAAGTSWIGGESKCSASSDVGVPLDVREVSYVGQSAADDASETAMKISLLFVLGQKRKPQKSSKSNIDRQAKASWKEWEMPKMHIRTQAQVRESNDIVAANTVCRCHCRGRVGGYVWFLSRTGMLPTLADRVFP